jgi:hypothetical protein
MNQRIFKVRHVWQLNRTIIENVQIRKYVGKKEWIK